MNGRSAFPARPRYTHGVRTHRPPAWRPLLTALLALGACKGGSAPPSGPIGQGWGAPVVVQAGLENGHTYPSVVLAEDGGAVAAWERRVHPDLIEKIWWARLPAGSAAWEPPAPLHAGASYQSAPRLVRGAGGALALAFQEELQLQVCAGLAGGGWSEPVVLDAAYQRFLGLDAAGGAVAVWYQTPAGLGSDLRVPRAARRDAATGTWSAPVDLLPAAASLMEGGLAVGEGGDAVAVWSSSETFDGVHQVHAVRLDAASGAWSAPERLQAGDGAGSDARVVPVPGGAVATWVEEIDAARNSHLMASVLSGGTWSAPARLSEGTAWHGFPDLAAGAGGDVVAAWTRKPGIYGTDRQVWASVRAAATGAWSAPAALHDRAVLGELPALAVNRRGHALAAWFQDAPPAGASLVASRFDGAGWSTPVAVHHPGIVHDLALALNDAGQGMVLWTQPAPDGAPALMSNRYEPPASAGARP